MKISTLTLNTEKMKITSVALLFAGLMMLFAYNINAQEYGGSLTLAVDVNESGKSKEGVMVTFYHDADGTGNFAPIDQFMTGGNCKFKFDLRYNSNYLLELAAPGDVRKTVQFNTRKKPGTTDENTKFDIDVDFAKIDNYGYPERVEYVYFEDEMEQFVYKQDNTEIQTAGAILDGNGVK